MNISSAEYSTGEVAIYETIIKIFGIIVYKHRRTTTNSNVLNCFNSPNITKVKGFR